ncbi:MAG TPA: hypothetical protein PLW93_02985 [Candidatus Absconditabacterales bacterium]|nr:hypothetical protein [Candidatus Absconditabacterales bacterium]HNG97215.1 hypothetical protein [Candidatus Absconditabacterales bacterium]
MTIKITKEKSKQYFAQIIGQDGVHTVGNTPEKALEYLADVYEQTMEVKKQKQ